MRLFSEYIRGENFSFKHAWGSSDRSGKEFHIYHEIILFLDGDGEFITEDLHLRPEPYTLILIPSQTYHQMVIHGHPEHYHRCVLQFGQMEAVSALIEKSLNRVQAIKADRQIRYLFDKLIAAAKAENGALILQSVLVLLLDSLASQTHITDDGLHQNATIRRAVEYINQNLDQPLSIGEIAQACNISASSLSHIFQREMYISVHKFILKKRLMLAYHKIRAGEAATTAALESGFRDYSGFYKQYKKAFGFPPSQNKI